MVYAILYDCSIIRAIHLCIKVWSLIENTQFPPKIAGEINKIGDSRCENCIADYKASTISLEPMLIVLSLIDLTRIK